MVIEYTPAADGELTGVWGQVSATHGGSPFNRLLVVAEAKTRNKTASRAAFTRPRISMVIMLSSLMTGFVRGCSAPPDARGGRPGCGVCKESRSSASRAAPLPPVFLPFDDCLRPSLNGGHCLSCACMAVVRTERFGEVLEGSQNIV
ncbi:hypothetical protein ACWCQL_20590 [Streptomyces sp. NPDC002073]